jgi:hypothetical protein
MTKEDQETSGSLRSSHGRESSWVVEFSVTKWSRLHGGSVMFRVATLQSWPRIVMGSGILGHEMVTTSWRFCDV